MSFVSHVVVGLGMDVHEKTYHVMQPVRTFGLLALVFFLRGSADEDDGLLALLLGSTLERLEYDRSDMVMSTTRVGNHGMCQGTLVYFVWLSG